MSKYTLGPWKCSIRPNGPFWHISAEHSVGGEPCKDARQAVAAVYATNKKSSPKYSEMFRANAQLIATAPELLEFAEEVRRTGDTRLASMAIAVINRATGN